MRELADTSRGFLGLGVVVCGFYLAMSVPLAHFARRLERRLSGAQRAALESSTAA